MQTLIRGFEEYKIFKNGEIIGKYGRKLKPRISPDGYARVQLRKKKKSYSRSIHRLVLENFTSTCPNGKECNHKNGIKHDNRLENLEWVTRSQNIKHAFRIGLQSQKGERSTRAKLTNFKVKTIRFLLKNTTISHYKIAEMFEVTRPVISNIKARRIWNYTEAGA